MIDQEEFGAGHIGPHYGIFQGPPGLYPRECLLSQGIKNLRIKFPSKCPGISPSSIYYNLLTIAGTILGGNINTCGPHYLPTMIFILWMVVSTEQTKI